MRARDVDGTVAGPLTLLDSETLTVLPNSTVAGSITRAVTGDLSSTGSNTIINKGTIAISPSDSTQLSRTIVLNSGIVENWSGATITSDPSSFLDANNFLNTPSAIRFQTNGTLRNSGTITGLTAVVIEGDGALYGANGSAELGGTINGKVGYGIFLGDWRGRAGRTTQGKLLDNVTTATTLDVRASLGDAIAIGDLNDKTFENKGFMQSVGARMGTPDNHYSGLAIGSGSGTIINRGTIMGISATASLNDVNDPDDWAISVKNYGAATNQRVSVVNYGRLVGGGGVSFEGDGWVENKAGGKIEILASNVGGVDIGYGRVGVFIGGRLISDLVNDGEIQGQINIRDLNDRAIRNSNTSQTAGAEFAAIWIKSGRGSIVNTGTISGGIYSIWVDRGSGATTSAVTVQNSGLIDRGIAFVGDGAVTGIDGAAMNGTITNFGQGKATIFVGNWLGRNDTTGSPGAQGKLLANLEIHKDGKVKGDPSWAGTAIMIGDLNGKVIRNAGEITATGGGGSYSVNRPIEVDAGVFIGSGSGIVSNTGTVQGGVGIYISNYTAAGQAAALQQVTVENSGTIKSGGAAAIRFEGDGAVTGINGGEIGGTIQGGGIDQVIPATGVIFIGDWRGTIALDNVVRGQGKLISAMTFGSDAKVIGYGTPGIAVGNLNNQTITNKGTITLQGFARVSGIAIGSGSGRIVNTNTIAGVKAGVEVSNYAPAGQVAAAQTVTVENSGTITGRTAVWFDGDGILTGVGGGAVTGTLSGTVDYGVFIGDWRGARDSNNVVRAQGKLLANLENAGTISSGGLGGLVVGDLNGKTITNSGTISGNNAIDIGQGIGQITNAGTITGTRYGINLANYAGTGTTVALMPKVLNDTGRTITATGTSTSVGVRSVGALELANRGTITARMDGIESQGGGIVTNEAGATIRGDSQTAFNGGSAVYFSSATASGTVVNAGALSGSGTVFFAGPSSSLTNTGTIDAFQNAVFYQRSGTNTLTNSGTITGGIGGDTSASQTNWATVFSNQNLSVTNAASGKLYSRNSNVVIESSAGLTLVNDGLIQVVTPFNNVAPTLRAGTAMDLVNSATGKILTAGDTRIAIGGNASTTFKVDNAGEILGQVTFRDRDDLYILRDDAKQTGLVTGGAGANVFEFALAVGKSRSFGPGAGGTNPVTFTQFGTVRKSGAGQLTSVGTIDAGVNVIDVQGGTFVNQGTIAAQAGRQVLMSGDATTLINPNGATLSAPIVASAGTLRQSVFNEGTITGAIDLKGGDDYVSNRGTITGNVDLGDGNDSVVWWVTANGNGQTNGTSGLIVAGNGLDTLLLGVDAGQSVTVTSQADLTPASAPAGFEGVGKAGDGTMTWAFPTALDTQQVRVLGGRLILNSDVNANLSAPGATDGSGRVQLDGAGSVLEINATLAAQDRIEMRADSTSLITNATGIITVGPGGTGLITGDDDRQTIDNAGAINALVSLGGGSDLYVLRQTGAQNGQVDGGAGADTFQYDVTGARSVTGAEFINFETVRKTGGGTLTLTGALDTAVTLVDVQGGTFANTGTIAAGTTVGLASSTTFQNSGTHNGAVVGSGSGVTIENSGTIGGTVTLTGGGNRYTLTATGTQVGLVTGGNAAPAVDNRLLVETAAGGRTLAAGRFVNFQQIDLNADAASTGVLRLQGAAAPATAASLDTGGGAGTSITLNRGSLSLFEAGSSLRAQTITFAAGTTLSGIGTVYNGAGGTTTVAGTLAPGNSPGMLTFNGNLALVGGALLNYELGQANTAGGALNDLSVVTGNLTLNGTLTVTQSAGGNFTNGVYRLFTYGGTLSGTLAAPAVLPNGLNGSIQTSVAGQVNLVVLSAGATTQYWDGQEMTANGQVDGGTYFWRPTPTNWTLSDGSTNAAWAGGLAVVQGTSGVVTVEDGYRPTFEGLQFNVGQYRIIRSALRPATNAFVTVTGDFDTTIESVLEGSGSLAKHGNGRLILTGANTYTGGTSVASGTLQLGEGGTTGSIVGNVATSTGGTLAFNRSDTVTFAGVVSGQGALSQIGPGTTILTANNTYTGGTTVSAGTLQIGNGGTTGSIVGNVATAAGSVLAFNRTDTSTFGGVVSGAGALNQIGTGTTVLTGNSSYAGGTTVAAGTLQLGSGGTAGWIQGNVVTAAGGTLAFNRSDTVVFTGTVSGGGAIAQIGTGTTILVGNSTYAGGTTVTAGMLMLGAGGPSGWVEGNIVNNGTVAFNRADAVTFSATMSGSGGLWQMGSGRTNLTAANTYTGPTQVQAGTLSVNGSITSDTTVMAGGTLGGNGTITGTVVNGGTIAPGNSIGQLDIVGPYTQAAGSTYQVELNAGGQADRILVTGAPGTATIQGGTVAVVAQPGLYPSTYRYTIVTATGGVTGQYAGLANPYAFLRPTITYDANNVYLELTRSFTGGAATCNQYAVAGALDRVLAAGGDFATVVGALAVLDAMQGPAALDTVSGQPYAGFGTANLFSGSLFGTAVRQQMSLARNGQNDGSRAPIATTEGAASPLSSWIAALGGTGTVAGSGVCGQSTQTYSAGGVAAGVDYAASPWARLGLAVGYTSGTQWTNGFNSRGTSDAVLFGAYADFTQGGAYASLMAGYAWNMNQMTRQITIPGLSPRVARSQTGAGQWFAQAELGYRFAFDAGSRTSLTPFARLEASTVTQDGFTEWGADGLNLAVSGQATTSLRSVLGAEVAASWNLGWQAPLDLQLRVGWVHDHADMSRPVNAAFAAAPATAFTVQGAAPPRDSVTLGLGLATLVDERYTFFLRYDADFAAGANSHSINLGVRFRW